MTGRKILLAEQTISRGELDELADWLRGDPWLTQGPLVAEFEQRWADWVGTRHSVMVNSGSSANLLMYYALLVSGRLANRKVIVPAIGWATTVAPAIQFGFEPVVCDADPHTFGLDLRHLETLLARHRPGAVILVHVLGCPNDMEAILKLKAEYGFLLMEDCCAAHGSTFDGRKVGTFGDLSSFSFFYGHHMSTIEGGAVNTGDEGLRDVLRMIRAHGWAKDLAPGKEAELAGRYRPDEFNRMFTFYLPGFNVRSTDLNAKIGLMQLRTMDDRVARRAENHRAYQKRLSAAPGFTVQQNDRATISSISFVTLAESNAKRAAIVKAVRAAGIETRPLGGGNMSRQPFFAERVGAADLPMADRIGDTAFHLPNHHLLTPDDVNAVCDVVLGA